MSLERIGLALDTVPAPGPWVEQGACRTAPMAAFFPRRGEDAVPAQRVCAACPVIAPCRQYAIDAGPELLGVWGGTTGAERARLRRALGVEEASTETRAVTAPPRAPASPRGTLFAVLEQLVEHPGRWAKVGHYASRDSASAMASLLRSGQTAAPPGAWTFEGRRNDAGGSDLYALRLAAEAPVVAS